MLSCHQPALLMRSSDISSEELRYLRREQIFVLLFVLFLSATLSHFVNEHWLESAALARNYAASLTKQGITPPSDVLYAPNAYRIAMPSMTEFVQRHFFSGGFNYVFSAFDFIFSGCALFLFSRFAVFGLSLQSSERSQRVLRIALFLAFSQFALAWVVPWQRPETMPSAFFLACALWCVAKAGNGGAWIVGLICVTVFQSFVRADVAFIFGCGLLLAALTCRNENAGMRRTLLARGLIVALLAALVQAYLQFVKFSHLHYPPGVPLLTYQMNLTFHNLGDGILAVLPLLAGVAPAVLSWRKVPPLHRTILLSALLYLGLWASVAILDEVRVYVPFLMMLSVTASSACAQWVPVGRLAAEN